MSVLGRVFFECKRLIAATALLSALCGGALAQAACANADALGTSRVLRVGTAGGPATGLKTYPRRLPLADHEVVLTFDDGPLPGPTNKVLAALSAECVRATFFLIGRNAAASPELVRRETAAGHTIGHHSYSHPGVTLRGLSDAAARADIDRGISAVDVAAYGAAGARPRTAFFRFPGFADTAPLLAWLAGRDIAVFGADLWASDWAPMTPEAELALVLARLEQARRGVILFHDTKAQTAAMLPAFLRALKARGYRVVHIVPGDGAAATEAAGPGWRSETERTLERMWPRVRGK